jgi:hypothetical protein
MPINRSRIAVAETFGSSDIHEFYTPEKMSGAGGERNRKRVAELLGLQPENVRVISLYLANREP